MSYRDQALKLFPHICARCAREFAGKRLQDCIGMPVDLHVRIEVAASKELLT